MKRLLALAAATISTFSISCNQDDGNTVTPDPGPSNPTTCRLTSLASPDYTFNISYDGSKRVSEHTLVYDSTTRKTYSYASDYYTRTETYNGALASRDTVRLNSAGYVASVTVVFLTGSSSGQVTRLTYDYNSDNKVTKENVIYSSTQTIVAKQYEYDASGNISKMTPNGAGASPTTYTYYTDKTTRTGDAMENEQLMDWGAGKLFNNTHLLKSSTRNGVTTNYVYTFDANDRITSYTVQRGSASPLTVAVQQTCD